MSNTLFRNVGFRSKILLSHSRPRDPQILGNTRFRNVGFRSIVLPSHSRPRDPLISGSTRFRNVGLRSIVLPSHSRPGDPLMWTICAFESSGTTYSMTLRRSLNKRPLLLRCRKVSIDPHNIFLGVRVSELLKQFVPSVVGSSSHYVCYFQAS